MPETRAVQYICVNTTFSCNLHIGNDCKDISYSAIGIHADIAAEVDYCNKGSIDIASRTIRVNTTVTHQNKAVMLDP